MGITITLQDVKDGNVSIGSRIFLVIFGLAFAAAGGLGIFSVTIKPLIEYAEVSLWDETPCTIKTSVLGIDDTGNKSRYSANIEYTYTREGVEYTGTQLFLGNVVRNDLADAQETLERFPAGMITTCRVDPANPENALLIPELHGGIWSGGAFSLVFVAMGLGIGAFGIFRGRKRKKQEGEPETAAPTEEKSSGVSWKTLLGITAFFATFFAVGTFVFVWITVIPIFRYYSVQNWVETPCLIEAGKVSVERGSKSSSFDVDIRYTYEYQGVRHISKVYDISSSTNKGRDKSAEIVRRYPSGERARCYVNPANPREAILDRSLPSSIWWGLLGLLFVAVGSIGVIPGTLGIFAKLRGKERPLKIMGSSVTGKEPRKAPTEIPSHALLARSTFGFRLSRRTEMIGLWLITVGIGVFALVLVRGDLARFFSISFDDLFRLPLIAILLFCLYKTIRVSLLNSTPVIQLTLTPGILQPGTNAQLEWRYDISKRTPSAINMRLLGKKITRTDKRSPVTNVYEMDISDITDPKRTASGEIAFELPQSPIFHNVAEDADVRWFIAIRTHFPKWPDAKDEFRVEVAGASGVPAPDPPADRQGP